MRTLPFIVTILALWIIFVSTLYLAFGMTFPTVLLAVISIGGLLVSVFSYRYYGWPYADKGSFTDISPDALYSMLGKSEVISIVDVRGAGEYASGHLPGARNIPLSQIERGSAMNEGTVFVSGSGKKSRIAIRRVKGRHLFNLRDGYSEWVGENLPVEK